MVKAIVTGAARGIGAAIADRLVSDGGAVAYVDVIEEVTTTAASAMARLARLVLRDRAEDRGQRRRLDVVSRLA